MTGLATRGLERERRPTRDWLQVTLLVAGISSTPLSMGSLARPDCGTMAGWWRRSQGRSSP